MLLQKPTPLITSNTGNLLRCFVRRDPGGEKAVAKFSLFLGQEHNQPEACKFLMAALLNSRYTAVQCSSDLMTGHCMVDMSFSH